MGSYRSAASFALPSALVGGGLLTVLDHLPWATRVVTAAGLGVAFVVVLGMLYAVALRAAAWVGGYPEPPFDSGAGYGRAALVLAAALWLWGAVRLHQRDQEVQRAVAVCMDQAKWAESTAEFREAVESCILDTLAPEPDAGE